MPVPPTHTLALGLRVGVQSQTWPLFLLPLWKLLTWRTAKAVLSPSGSPCPSPAKPGRLPAGAALSPLHLPHVTGSATALARCCLDVFTAWGACVPLATPPSLGPRSGESLTHFICASYKGQSPCCHLLVRVRCDPPLCSLAAAALASSSGEHRTQTETAAQETPYDLDPLEDSLFCPCPLRAL